MSNSRRDSDSQSSDETAILSLSSEEELDDIDEEEGGDLALIYKAKLEKCKKKINRLRNKNKEARMQEKCSLDAATEIEVKNEALISLLNRGQPLIKCVYEAGVTLGNALAEFFAGTLPSSIDHLDALPIFARTVTTEECKHPELSRAQVLEAVRSRGPLPSSTTDTPFFRRRVPGHLQNEFLVAHNNMMACYHDEDLIKEFRRAARRGYRCTTETAYGKEDELHDYMVFVIDMSKNSCERCEYVAVDETNLATHLLRDHGKIKDLEVRERMQSRYVLTIGRPLALVPNMIQLPWPFKPKEVAGDACNNVNATAANPVAKGNQGGVLTEHGPGNGSTMATTTSTGTSSSMSRKVVVGGVTCDGKSKGVTSVTKTTMTAKPVASAARESENASSALAGDVTVADDLLSEIYSDNEENVPHSIKTNPSDPNLKMDRAGKSIIVVKRASEAAGQGKRTTGSRLNSLGRDTSAGGAPHGGKSGNCGISVDVPSSGGMAKMSRGQVRLEDGENRRKRIPSSPTIRNKDIPSPSREQESTGHAGSGRSGKHGGASSHQQHVSKKGLEDTSGDSVAREKKKPKTNMELLDEYSTDDDVTTSNRTSKQGPIEVGSDNLASKNARDDSKSKGVAKVIVGTEKRKEKRSVSPHEDTKRAKFNAHPSTTTGSKKHGVTMSSASGEVTSSSGTSKRDSERTMPTTPSVVFLEVNVKDTTGWVEPKGTRIKVPADKDLAKAYLKRFDGSDRKLGKAYKVWLQFKTDLKAYFDWKCEKDRAAGKLPSKASKKQGHPKD